MVARDGHVEADKAFCSLRLEYVTRRLRGHRDSRMVRIFSSCWEVVEVHSKCEPGRFRSDATHITREKVFAVERGIDAGLCQIDTIGSHTESRSEVTT
ncbi:hypothetical protein [Roseiconus lacunae]|uniref:Uncharacterized protein n=1 Tax=Roseiconus lacunae TaxID=2605694 RepID=A0ABT7PSR8_9BACT|nr:hypothetical protein [Roseiconus lacunae]MDM4019324.1 hypothetical protein [Roseiconus lacunae]